MALRDLLYRNTLVSNIIIVISGLTLINSREWFVYPSDSSFYFFSICVAFFATVVVLKLLLLNGTFNIGFSIFSFVFLVVYVLFHGLFIKNHGWNNWHYYYLSTGIFFTTVCILLINKKINISHIGIGFISFAMIESAVCIAQYIGWIESMTNYFFVSGSWINPNVTAMFIALVFPIALLGFISARGKFKIAYALILSLLLVGLYLLKCRSAYLCVFVSGIVCCYFSFLKQLKKNGIFVCSIVIILIVGAIPTMIHLYKIKKESADGRLLIYKTSLAMVIDSPMSGRGFGLFEKYYNLKQADYINNGQASIREISNARHVNMAYNELLQHGVEGGVPGLILFFSIFAVLIFRGYHFLNYKGNKPDNYLIAAYGVVSGYFIMSLVNFTWQAIPATYVFIFYAAVLAAYDKPIFFKKRQTVALLVLLTASVCLLYKQTEKAIASYKNKTALQYIKQRNMKEAIGILMPLKKVLDKDESFWNNLAYLHFNLRQYRQAIKALDNAQLYSSKPGIFHLKARCYERLEMIEPAIANWQTAALIEPNRMLPLYQLMNLYIYINDHKNALLKARQLMALKPKGVSRKAIIYKQKAIQVLRLFEVKERI